MAEVNALQIVSVVGMGSYVAQITLESASKSKQGIIAKMGGGAVRLTLTSLSFLETPCPMPQKADAIRSERRSDFP